MKIKSFKPKLHKKPQFTNTSPAVAVSQTPSQNTNNNLEVQRSEARSQPVVTGKSLRVIPLGGVGYVQKNMFVYEYGEDIIIVDCGVGFPDEGMPGVDLIIPDISYLRDKKSRIKAIIITHAHDDHIGGLPYLWPELNVPIYSQKLTCGFIKNKFTEHNLPKDQIKTLTIDDTLKLGVFEVSFYQVSHSVPDSTGIVIKTPVGTLIHQADFKIDWTPVNGQVTDVAKIARISEVGVKFLTIDSLGSEKPGYTLSEKNIQPTFERIEQQTEGKFVITLISSNIARIQQAINVAVKAGRKVALAGRSLENNFQVSRDLGYLDVPPNILIAQDEIKRFPDNKLMIIMAGSFGQVGSALYRAANNDHKFVRLGKKDIVVFSADPMPSAVVDQGALIDSLSKICNVYASALTPDLHVSGHAAREELKVMLSLIKPEYIMPMGGEYHHMKALSKMAQDLGYREDQILLPQEGDVIEISSNKTIINGYVQTSNVYVDGLGVGDVGSIVLRDRQVMAEEGMVVVVITVDQKTGQVVGEPEVISRGFVFEKTAEEMIEQAREVVKSVLDEHQGPSNWKYLRHQIEENLEKFFYQEIKRNPLILPVIVEV